MTLLIGHNNDDILLYRIVNKLCVQHLTSLERIDKTVKMSIILD